MINIFDPLNGMPTQEELHKLAPNLDFDGDVIRINDVVKVIEVDTTILQQQGIVTWVERIEETPV